MDAFIADLFRKRAKVSKEYKTTSALSSIIFNTSKGMGLMYPSVQYLGGWNYAIPADLFDKSYLITGCAHIKIEKIIGYGLHYYTVLAASENIDNDGEITWVKTDRTEK